LLGNPQLGRLDRFVKPTPLSGGPLDHSAIDEEQKDSNPTAQGSLGPVFGSRQVVFEMETGVTKSLFDEGLEMFVVAVTAIGSQQVDPLARKVTNR